MKKYKKDILILIIIFIYVGILVSFSNADNDLIWNYGFSYNIASNLIVYKDFNMVITPLYPFICGLVMNLLGNNFFIFNLINIVLLNGNVVYKGEDSVINYFDSLDSNTYFLLNLEYEGGQLSKKIDSYIRNNYKKVKVFNNLILYKRW